MFPLKILSLKKQNPFGERKISQISPAVRNYSPIFKIRPYFIAQDLIKNASITSLPVECTSNQDKMPRCSSLITLLRNPNLPSQKERLILNKYLYAIKEESDEHFKKFIEMQNDKKLMRQEDIINEEEENFPKNIPMSLMSASRYESNTSIGSSIKVNIPHRTKSRNCERVDNSMTEVLETMRKPFPRNLPNKPFSQNYLNRKSNSVFRTFEGKIEDI